MAMKPITQTLVSFAITMSLSAPLAAQTTEEVKTDVLSALSTPLPITIIGPLLTRDVAVTQESDGFRAVLQDTTLLGLFPFGDVSFHMAPAGEDTYRITDLSFAKTLDFPGIGTLTFSGMEFDGTWSTKTRSYSTLKWLTKDATFKPDMGGLTDGVQEPAPSISMSSLLFDVLKEPDNTNTESKFAITVGDLAVLGMGPQNVTLGEVTAVLAANGEKPVDLYSVIREVLMLGSVRDGGAHLQALGQSLLGNTYDTVTLDLGGRDLKIQSMRGDDGYFNAGSLHATAALKDVQPRDWGSAGVTLRFGDVDQYKFLPDANLKLGEAVVRISGAELPVANMMTTFMTLAEPPRRRPVDASMLLDGLMGFGKIEIATEGKAIWFEAFDRRYRDGDYVTEKAFETSYDTWNGAFALEGLNRDQGTLRFGTELTGGTIVLGDTAPEEVKPHIDAWFPKELAVKSSVSNLNEALLKRMFKDVQIQNLQEPVEIVTPLVIYAASTVMEMASGENLYETALFRIEQKGNLRFYPTEVLSMMPYEGTSNLSMTGLPALVSYFDGVIAELRPRSDEAAALNALKSGLIVLRNLAKEGDNGAYEWTIARPDVTRREVMLNDVTLRYPDFAQYMPMFAFMGVMGRF